MRNLRFTIYDLRFTGYDSGSSTIAGRKNLKSKIVNLKYFYCLLLTAYCLLFFSGDAFAIKKTREEIEASKRCVLCHTQISPGIINDWERSNHAKALVTCIDCHQADITDTDAKKHEGMIISAIVSPKDCSRCHPKQVMEFNESLHSKAVSFVQNLEGDRAGDDTLAYKIEGKAAAVMGCEKCHGTIVKVKNGIFDKDTWPNNGIGRVNPDGSKGSCTACHTRHLFSIAESRKPETCGTCHMGPDHPQYEIYMESKHGVIYSSEKQKWNMDVASSSWDTRYFRAPTCAICHMSGIGGLEPTHNVSDRLSWELEWPMSERTNDWKGKREKMQMACLSCHSKNWVEGYYQQFFKAEDGLRDDLVTGVQTCALPIGPLRRDAGLEDQRPGVGAFARRDEGD